MFNIVFSVVVLFVSLLLSAGSVPVQVSVSVSVIIVWCCGHSVYWFLRTWISRLSLWFWTVGQTKDT